MTSVTTRATTPTRMMIFFMAGKNLLSEYRSPGDLDHDVQPPGQKRHRSRHAGGLPGHCLEANGEDHEEPDGEQVERIEKRLHHGVARVDERAEVRWHHLVDLNLDVARVNQRSRHQGQNRYHQDDAAVHVYREHPVE